MRSDITKALGLVAAAATLGLCLWAASRNLGPQYQYVTIRQQYGDRSVESVIRIDREGRAERLAIADAN